MKKVKVMIMVDAQIESYDGGPCDHGGYCCFGNDDNGQKVIHCDRCGETAFREIEIEIPEELIPHA